MNGLAGQSNHRSSRYAPPVSIACPACGSQIEAAAQRCPVCHFTGEASMKVFPTAPPPLSTVIDAAGILSENDIGKIKAARNVLRRQYPQFRWRICSVRLPPETSLPMFGFWLLNACPLQEGESAGERAWTVLLVINAATGQAAVIPGYAAETILTDDEWQNALAAMTRAWRARKPALAICQYLKAADHLLNQAWKRHNARRSR